MKIKQAYQSYTDLLLVHYMRRCILWSDTRHRYIGRHRLMDEDCYSSDTGFQYRTRTWLNMTDRKSTFPTHRQLETE